VNQPNRCPRASSPSDFRQSLRRLVFFVLAKLPLFTNVGVESPNKRSTNGRILRVIIRGFADQVVGRPGKARVQTARGQPAVALQFLHQLKQTQAQVGFVEIVFTESRETRHFFDDLRFFCLADRIALHEGIRVFPRANLRASSRKVFKFSGRSFSVLWNQAVAA